MADTDKNTLLLVEDDTFIAMAEKMVLEKYGYTVISRNTGEKAVELINSLHTHKCDIQRIDLILMDIDLGKGIDGTEAAEKILKDHDIPVIFLSSHVEKEIVERTEKITSYGYVVKGSSVTVLDASIKMAFKLFEAKTSAAQAAEQFRAIVENTADYIMRYDRHGRHLYGNPSTLTVSGFTLDAYVGKTHRELGFPEELCLLWENSIEDVFRTGLPKTIDFEADLAKGRAILQLQFSPEFNAKGVVNSVIGVSRDITILKRTEENLRTHQLELQIQNDELRAAQADMDALRLRHFNLYDMATVAYFTLTASGLIKEANLTACAMLGLNRSTLEGSRFGAFITEVDEDSYYQYRKKLLEAGISQHCSLRMRRQDGSAFSAYLKGGIAQAETGEDVCRLAVMERELDRPVESRQGDKQ